MKNVHSGRMLKPPRQLFDKEPWRMLCFQSQHCRSRSTRAGSIGHKIPLTRRRGAVLLQSKHTQPCAHLARSCSADLCNSFILGCCGCPNTIFSSFSTQSVCIDLLQGYNSRTSLSVVKLTNKQTTAVLFPIDNTKKPASSPSKALRSKGRSCGGKQQMRSCLCVFYVFISFFI